MQLKSMRKRNGREWAESEATLYPWQWDSESSQAYNAVGFPRDSSLIRCDLGAITQSTAHPAAQAVSWLGKIAKGKMHEQPRWKAREVVMEGDEWRRFGDAGDSSAEIESIKLLRIF